MEVYDREIKFWNEIYSECQPTDLRKINLIVQPGFDGILHEFGEKTSCVLDFGCGTGDIIFQYMQEFPEKKGVGSFANSTTKVNAIIFMRRMAFSVCIRRQQTIGRKFLNLMEPSSDTWNLPIHGRKD